MSTGSPSSVSRFVRRRPKRGIVIVVLPTAWLRRWSSRALIGLVTALYVANFALAEVVVQGRLGKLDLLREFPVTSWGLYADLAPDETANTRIRFELKNPWDSAAFDDYVRRYPKFMPGAFHARTAVLLGRGREYPVRLTLRFLMDRYCFEHRPACEIAPDGSRPDVVTVRQTVIRVNRGRLSTHPELDKLTEIGLSPSDR